MGLPGHCPPIPYVVSATVPPEHDSAARQMLSCMRTWLGLLPHRDVVQEVAVVGDCHHSAPEVRQEPGRAKKRGPGGVGVLDEE